MSVGPVHYRIDDEPGGDGVLLVLTKWVPVKETPQGYWVVKEGVSDYGWGDEFLRKKKYKRFVLKNSYKRFCYPSFEEALNSFRIRKVRYQKRLELRLACVKEALAHLGSHPEMSLADFAGAGYGEGRLTLGKPEIFNDFFWD